MKKKYKQAFDPEIVSRANGIIAQGALTNSKRPSCFVYGVYPTHLVKSQGCQAWDTLGNSYFDFIMGLGSVIIGHGNPQIVDAMKDQALLGMNHSLGSVLEIDLGEKLKELFPFIERVKFLKTGSEACTAAVRIARTHTRRWQVLTEGYHGWHDEFIAHTPPALGVCPHPMIESFVGLDQITDHTAAVIIEPIQTDIGSKRVDFLRQLREKCDETGTVLIFDEIITGFRWPGFSVSNYLNIIPDLICLGKAMGGGMPISAVGGSREILECDQYFVSSTFAGEQVSMAAALKCIEILQKKLSFAELWETSTVFLNAFNSICPEKIKLTGYPSRCVFEGEQKNKAIFFQEAIKSGLLFGNSFFISFDHLPYMAMIENTCISILQKMKCKQIQLEGELPSSPFAQAMRKH